MGCLIERVAWTSLQASSSVLSLKASAASCSISASYWVSNSSGTTFLLETLKKKLAICLEVRNSSELKRRAPSAFFAFLIALDADTGSGLCPVSSLILNCAIR